MSYDIDLLDPVTKKTIKLDCKHQMKGGTYAQGGTEYACLNVTYNYSRFFYDLFGDKGIRFLYGKTAAETIPHLKEASELLNDDVDSDYWKATEGNVKRALLQLLALAELRPDGVWSGD